MTRTVHLRIRRVVADRDTPIDSRVLADVIREQLSARIAQMPADVYADRAAMTQSVGDVVRRVAGGAEE